MREEAQLTWCLLQDNLQEKSREQQKPLSKVFIDLTKAFDSVNREVLWQVLGRFGCPSKFVNLIKQLHERMSARVIYGGEKLEGFYVQTGVKQGCVLAPNLFALFLAAMLTEMNHCVGDRGVSVPYRMDGKFYNIRRFMAKTKTSITKFRDLLYADDCALVAPSAEEMQHIVSCFNNAAVSFGLQINIKRTKCLFQPAPGAETTADDIFVSGEALKKVSTFSYLGSVISDDCTINNDIVTCLQKANRSYGALQKRLWSQRGIKVKLKSKYARQSFLQLFYMGHNHGRFTGETRT